MPFLPAALAIGSAIAGGVSSFSAGQYQAAIAKRNATIAEQNAGKSSDAAQMKAYQSDRQGAALLGEQAAIQGASGLSGTSQYFLRQQTQDALRQDRTNISLEGLAQSRNDLQESANFRAQASQANTQSLFDLGQGFLKAGGAALKNGGPGGTSLIGGSKSSRISGRIRNGG